MTWRGFSASACYCARMIGAIPLRELTAADVRAAFTRIGATRSSRTVTIAHQVLTRAIRHAEANDLVRRNVASLIRAPRGCSKGRASRTLNLGQAVALLGTARRYRLHAYVVLSLTTGIRSEEARRSLGSRRPGCVDHLDLAVGESPWRCENADLTADVGSARDGRQGVAGTPGTAAARAPERRAALARARPRVRINSRHTARPLPRSTVAAAHIPQRRDRRRLGTARPQAHVR